MKKIAFIFILFLTFSFFSQKSYTFLKPMPAGATAVKTVSENWFGTYDHEDFPIDFEFSSDGVIAVSTIFNTLSRETVRESSQYVVRNGYIFGVVPNDSLPCQLDGDTYVFGIRTRQELVGSGSSNRLMKVNESTYILNFFDQNSYTPCLISFSGKNMQIRYFDYAMDTKIFNKIKIQQTTVSDAFQNILLDPTPEEWAKIPQDNYLGKALVYKKL